MIIRSPSLVRRLERETMRHIGSQAQVAFYSGMMPQHCDAAADGDKISTEPMSDALLEALARGREPMLPERARYWRCYDNGGICVMQGDGSPG